jgi:DNA-binding MarR family transcriptional regulator
MGKCPYIEVDPMNELEICNAAAIRQAARHVTQLYDTMLAPAGIGINQYSILNKLCALGPSNIQDLARRLVMDRSTLGHLLRPLETRGLIRLGTSKTDARTRDVRLTRAGRDLLEQSRPLWAAAQRRFEQTIGAEPSRRLRKSLRHVATTEFSP